MKNGSFYCFGNIFKLSSTKYLFIYPIIQFIKKVIQNDKEIIKILLNSILDTIIILVKENNEYILLYKNDKKSNVKKNLEIHIYKKNDLTNNNN